MRQCGGYWAGTCLACHGTRTSWPALRQLPWLSNARQLRFCQRRLSLLEVERSRRSCCYDKLLFLYYVRPQSSPFCADSEVSSRTCSSLPQRSLKIILANTYCRNSQGTTLEPIGIFCEPGGWRPVVVPFFYRTLRYLVACEARIDSSTLEVLANRAMNNRRPFSIRCLIVVFSKVKAYC